jgi:23S rRNA (uridine2552-2'-O)-methyltransferase
MRDRRDHWSAQAKKEGYPARSIYKLKEIEEKFRVIPPGGRVLDLGAAPGSWTLYALRLLGGRGHVTAVDLKPLDIGTAPDNLTFLQGDMTDAGTIEFLARRGLYDAVISDAAPATTGNRTVDTARSEALVEGVIELAKNLLKPGGACVVKIFQGTDQKRLLDSLRGLFSSAKAFKPRACRSESFETYFVGIGKKE